LLYIATRHRNGIDYGYTGEVRRIEKEKINARLAVGDVVQLTSIGFSSSGEVFHVDTEELAAETAAQLGAAKLIFLSEGQQMVDAETSEPVHCLRLREAREILAHFGQNAHPEEPRAAQEPAPSLAAADAAAAAAGATAAAAAGSVGEGQQQTDRLAPFPASHPYGARNYTAGMLELVEQSVRALAKGVARAHVVSPSNGALLQELFTRDGCGLLISRDIYDGIRPACARCVLGLTTLYCMP
jgi:amino-acid N-acetyltransferase